MSINSNPEDQPTVIPDSSGNPDLPNQPIIVIGIHGAQYVVPKYGAIADRASRRSGLQGALGSRFVRVRGSQRIEHIAATGECVTLDEKTTQYIVAKLKNAFAVGPGTLLSALPVASDQSDESDKLMIELDSIFSDLHEIDISIAGMQNSIDEKREATRSILAELKQLDT